MQEDRDGKSDEQETVEEKAAVSPSLTALPIISGTFSRGKFIRSLWIHCLETILIRKSMTR